MVSSEINEDQKNANKTKHNNYKLKKTYIN